MRNRNSQFGTDPETHATLARIQDALTALETEVGTWPDGSAEPAASRHGHDVSAIRARQAALETRNRSDEPSSGEIDRLRRDGERQRHTAQRGLEARGLEIGGPGSPSGVMDPPSRDAARRHHDHSHIGALRQDIDGLKSQLTRLAREDTVRELNHRWSAIEQEVAGMPHMFVSHTDLQKIVSRLDDLNRAVRHMPQSPAIERLESEMRTLATAVEQIARQGLVATVPLLQADLDARLDEICRAISASTAPVRGAIDKDAVDRIEARLGAIAQRIDAIATGEAGPTVPDLSPRFDELADRLESLHAVSQSQASVPAQACEALVARMDRIAQAVAGSDAAIARAIVPVATGLENRLADVDEQLRKVDERIGAHGRDLAASFDERLDNLTADLQRMQPAPATAPSFDHIDQRLDEMASMLAAATRPGHAPATFERLDAQIADIATQLRTGSAGAPIDNDTLISSVRSTVEQALSAMPSGSEASAEALAGLTADLRSIEDLASDREGRHARIFDAIHETLLEVVDHLSGLEEKFEHKIAAPATVDAPHAIPPVMATHAGKAPGTAAARPSGTRPPVPTMPLGPPAPISAGKASAGTAGHAMPPDAAEGPRWIFRDRAGRLPTRPSGTMSPTAATTAAEGADDRSFPSTDGHRIVPGTDQIALADIMARVRQGSATPAAAAAPAGQGEQGGQGGADFIAAARRAAQAAAADANRMATASPEDRADGKGRGKTASAKRRRPLLLGAAAILLAILTIPLVREPLDPSAPQMASPPAASIETAPDASATGTVQQQVALEPSPVEDGGTAQASHPDAAAPPVTGAVATSADDNTAPPARLDEGGPLPAAKNNGRSDIDGARAPRLGAPAAPAVIDGDIPDIVTSTALREAAVKGEPAALYVIGDLIANQPGEAEANMAAAFTWYERAANRGSAPAQYRVGMMYEKGLGAERNLATARTWHQRAADQGNASAMHNLAVLIARGATGQPDFERAARWFMEAAELGVRDSQYNLGILSAQGRGVPQSLVQSYKWFALAAAGGDQDAAARRDEIASILTPGQLQLAQDTARLWRPKPSDQAANVVQRPQAWQIDPRQTAAQAPRSAQDMRQTVRDTQRLLNANGYDAGPVDGVMGGKTREAIIAFQRDNDLPPTGQLDRALAEKLIALSNASG